MLNDIELIVEIILDNNGFEKTCVIVTDIKATTLDGENVYKFECVYKTNKGRGNASGYYKPDELKVFYLKL